MLAIRSPDLVPLLGEFAGLFLRWPVAQTVERPDPQTWSWPAAALVARSCLLQALWS